MRSNKLLIALMLVVKVVFAQTELTNFSMPYAKRKLVVGPYFTSATIANFSTKLAVGVDAEYMVTKNFGFGATIAGGQNYAEISTSVIGLIGLGNFQSDCNCFWLFALAPLTFENPTFHFKPDYNKEFVLSASFLKIRYLYDYGEPEQNLFFSGSVKLNYNVFYRPRWQWSFFVEGVALYTHNRPKGVQIGFSLRHVSWGAVR